MTGVNCSVIGNALGGILNQLLYLEKLSRPKYHEFGLKVLIFSMLQY